MAGVEGSERDSRSRALKAITDSLRTYKMMDNNLEKPRPKAGVSSVAYANAIRHVLGAIEEGATPEEVRKATCLT